MLVQLNKCGVVCGSDLQRGHSGAGCLTSSILFKYERSIRHLFVLGWARVRQVARGVLFWSDVLYTLFRCFVELKKVIQRAGMCKEGAFQHMSGVL